MERTSVGSLELWISEDCYSSPRLLERGGQGHGDGRGGGVVGFLAECAARAKFLHLSGPRVCVGVPWYLSQPSGQLLTPAESITVMGCIRGVQAREFGNLQGLFLSSGCFGTLDPSLPPPFKHISLPNLRELGIVGIPDAHPGGLEHLVHLFTEKLTHLKCEGAFWRRLRRAYGWEEKRRFESLRELEVEFLWSSKVDLDVSGEVELVMGGYYASRALSRTSSDDQDEERLVLPSLRHLCISESFALSQTAVFLEGIETPVLEVLEIAGDPVLPVDYYAASGGEREWRWLEELVTRSGRLRRVELNHNAFHSASFLEGRCELDQAIGQAQTQKVTSSLFKIPSVKISITIKIRPWSDCWTSHGKPWKAKPLPPHAKVLFEVDQGDLAHTHYYLAMIIGWTQNCMTGSSSWNLRKIGGDRAYEELRTRDTRDWKTGFWAGEAGRAYRKGRERILQVIEFKW